MIELTLIGIGTGNPDHMTVEAIAALATQSLTHSLTLQRLKKQKLALKDRIARIEDELTPDIIA